MLQIAICDADKKRQAMLLDYIARDIEIEDDYVTECFDSGDMVRERVEEMDFRFDLIFIGLDEANIAGLETASYLREKNVDIDIIFIADSAESITEGFHYRAFNYLVMPVDYERFAYEMSQYLLERRKYQKNCLSVSINGKQQMVLLNTVKYFFSEARKVTIVFQNGGANLSFYGKLNDIQEQVEELGFLRCHQSYLVNLYKVDQVSGEILTMQNEEFTISRKYADHVKTVWAKFNQRQYKGKTYGSHHLEELSGDSQSTVILTKNYHMGIKKYGILVGVRGGRKNDTFRLYDGEKSYLGRDTEQCQIIISEKTVSRRHLGIYFDEKEQCYFICDYSSNGTYINNMIRCPKGEWFRVERDTLLRLTSDDCVFLLG